MSVPCELCHVAILPRDLRFSTEGGDLHATCAQANGLTQKMPNPGSDLVDVLNTAGRLVGVADFRPTYGRFAVSRLNIIIWNDWYASPADVDWFYARWEAHLEGGQ